MSAHYNWVTLPAREFPKDRFREESIYYDPAFYQVEIVGYIKLDFVGHCEYLAVFKDLRGGKVFYAEFRNSDEFYDAKLSEKSMEYNGCGEARKYPEFFKVRPEKMEQFANYILGWKPNVWDYDLADRRKLVDATRAALQCSCGFTNCDGSNYK